MWLKLRSLWTDLCLPSWLRLVLGHEGVLSQAFQTHMQSVWAGMSCASREVTVLALAIGSWLLFVGLFTFIDLHSLPSIAQTAH